MVSQLQYLLDPEFVIPSTANRTRLEFWNRLNSCADESDARLGPNTLLELYNLTSNPPAVSGLASRDFWTIIKKFSGRTTSAVSPEKGLCETHLTHSYETLLGDEANSELLLADIKATGMNNFVGLFSIAECWPTSIPDKCSDCEISHVRILLDQRDATELRRVVYMQEAASDLRGIEKVACDLFPNIQFSDTAWNGLNTLVGAAKKNLSLVMQHLGVLNDFATEIWATRTTTKERIAELGARGVNGSPENSNTHKSRDAMKARSFVFDGKTVSCEWHTKLRPDKNRIYFSVDTKKVYVGTITQHLPL